MLIRIITLTAILAAHWSIGGAQTVIERDSRYEQQETLRNLDKGIFFARVAPFMVGKNVMRIPVPELNNVLADDYTRIDTKGRVITRDQELAKIKESSTKRAKSMQVTDCQVQVYQDMAVVRSTYNVDDPYDYDWYPTGDYRVTNLYKKRDGKWYLALSHWTMIFEPEKPQ